MNLDLVLALVSACAGGLATIAGLIWSRPMTMLPITHLTIHCAATPEGRNVKAETGSSCGTGALQSAVLPLDH
jgi:hypothetical protein